MDLLSNLSKRYLNLSLFEIALFLVLGIGLFYLFQSYIYIIYPDFIFKDNNMSIVTFSVNLFFTIFWVLTYLFLKSLLIFFYKYTCSFKSYRFKSEHWPDQWDYQGNIRLWKGDDNELYVTDSNSGCILKQHYWKNFEMNFECKFPISEANITDNQIIGIIFRAKNLSDFLMVQIHNTEGRINPHVRMEGNWEMIHHESKIIPRLQTNTFFKVYLKVLNESVNLSINGCEILNWIIPTNSDIRSTSDKDGKEYSFVPKIDFRKVYGRLGFRAFYNEGAIIKSLNVKRINSFL